MNSIGDRLKKLRETHKEKYGSKYTQSFIAKNILKTEPYILANYEGNRSKPSLEHCKLLSEFYNTTIEYILLGTLNEENMNLKSLEEFINNVVLTYDGQILTPFEKKLFVQIGGKAIKIFRDKD